MKKRYILISILVLLSLFGLTLYIVRSVHREPVFELHFFYLNRGRAIFLKTPQGKTVLIDGGQNSEVIRELTKLLPFYRRRIDYLIFTSANAKNIGGLSEVVERYEVGKVYGPMLLGTSTALFAFEKVLSKKSLYIERLEKGDEFEIDEVQFEVLFPDLKYKYNKSSLPELVLKIMFKDKTVLLLGDVSPTIQKSLIADVGRVDIVEFAHAAAKSRISPALLGHITPRITVSSKREKTLKFEFR